MAALRIADADIIFLCFFLSSFFLLFSSPNLSSRRLDVYQHVSTIGKKLVKQQCLQHMSSQYGELRPTTCWDLLTCFGYPSKFQRISRLGSVTARLSSSERQSKFAWLNRERHLHSAGRPPRWALALILVVLTFMTQWHHVWYLWVSLVKNRYLWQECSKG